MMSLRSLDFPGPADQPADLFTFQRHLGGLPAGAPNQLSFLVAKDDVGGGMSPERDIPIGKICWWFFTWDVDQAECSRAELH